MTRRKIPGPDRSALLLANQHACCVCGRGGVQIHHINGDPTDNREANLAVLCTEHHDKATAPLGLTARLTATEVATYKATWEANCADRLSRAARSRTAFFMLDYKNAERIRQLFAQLTTTECNEAYAQLKREFMEEEVLRTAQGFGISMEPNTRWDDRTERMLSWVQAAEPHPEPFREIHGHAKDPLYPVGGAVDEIRKAALYDLWCQIMVRAILAVRRTFRVEDLLALERPRDAGLAGTLLSFEGTIRGRVSSPSRWRDVPTSTVEIRCTGDRGAVLSTLELKTHYVYSDTAASSLSRGRANGVLALRGVERTSRRGEKRTTRILATPILIGSGVLRF